MNYKLFQDINQMAGHHPFLDGFMVFVTQKALIIYALTLLAMWFFGKEKYKQSVCFAAFTSVLALCISFVIGQIYFEARPFVSHNVNLLISHAADASFPSDHTTGAFSLAFAILFRHRKIGTGMLLLAILTGFSRVYVGHHYPFDVLGGIIVGLVSSTFIYKISPFLQPIANVIIRIYNKIPFVPKNNKSETRNF
ncbi:undecaprenyl-diphosphate phosphatase BcrC [Bacillus cereus]|uniref:Undecaprenyl-diphosphatase n=1 Tax=Bacillus thuringiensis TaxID=1428 RepID=A0A9X6WHA3_BACTU|nr:undecaprenyl-diphosphatase [Bacillus thuringiensis]PFJ29077.1 undecaprenyl-diphosphatase [Bacillus thuringiensis]